MTKRSSGLWNVRFDDPLFPYLDAVSYYRDKHKMEPTSLFKWDTVNLRYTGASVKDFMDDLCLSIVEHMGQYSEHPSDNRALSSMTKELNKLFRSMIPQVEGIINKYPVHRIDSMKELG